MNIQKYWEGKHKKYNLADWIEKPSLFAEFAVKYFPKQGKVLDLGAGQGQDSRYFSSLGYEVISTDLSDWALEVSKKHARDHKLDIDFQKLDLSKGLLPYDDESFDVVYASLSLHYFDDKITEKLFSEIRRILKKDGVVAILLNNIIDPKTQYLTKIADGLFVNPEGILRRFFSLDYLKNKVNGKFNSIIMDDKGEALLKDDPVDLIRFIGSKDGKNK